MRIPDGASSYRCFLPITLHVIRDDAPRAFHELCIRSRKEISREASDEAHTGEGEAALAPEQCRSFCHQARTPSQALARPALDAVLRSVAADPARAIVAYRLGIERHYWTQRRSRLCARENGTKKPATSSFRSRTSSHLDLVVARKVFGGRADRDL